MRSKALLLLCFLVMSCTDESKTSGTPEGGQRAVLNIDSAGSSADSSVPILDWSVPVDAEPQLTREELCALVPVSDTEEYCACYPQCCQNQRWYCPPNPQGTIDSMQVVVEICDENKEPCQFGDNPSCPPGS